MASADKYEAVIGLEVHAQLSTVSKLFCADATAFGAEANTQVSPITLAHPGTLPKLNAKAVELAIRMGMACECEINSNNYFARKNYFYPDLPKGYQVSQHTEPICKGGFVTIQTSEGEKKVKLNRIHLEEDAGKSIHDVDDIYTCIDLNRAGTPLIEIVTEPDMHSAEEAYQYVSEIRKLVRWLDVCDGNMEEGSLRCDANVSIRLKGDTALGTKVEVKNLNSIRNVKRAIEYEISRLIQLKEGGEDVIQQTRSFDATSDTTFDMRDKEEANDYRYFPEPDLCPLYLTDTYLNTIRKSLPELPNQLQRKYQDLGLSAYDSNLLTSDRSVSGYFEEVVKQSPNYKAAANWINGPLKELCNEQGKSLSELNMRPGALAGIIAMIDEGMVSFSAASSKLLPNIVIDPSADPKEMAQRLNLIQVRDTGEIERWVDEVIAKMPEKVSEYKKGKKGLVGLFVGEVKKLSKGKADPKMVTDLLEQKLNS